MHVPDGLMLPIVLLVGWAISIVVVGLSIRRASSPAVIGKVPLMSLLAAGIFVAQMLNFPVGGGTSGHLVGAALATLILGFAPAVLVMTIILVVQAFLFGDGGLTALGLNILNMGVIGCGVSHLVYGYAPAGLRRISMMTAPWLAVFIGALACAIQLGISHSVSGGTFGIPMAVALPAMLGYHAVIGVGETILTIGIVAYLRQVLPEIFGSAAPGGV